MHRPIKYTAPGKLDFLKEKPEEKQLAATFETAEKSVLKHNTQVKI